MYGLGLTATADTAPTANSEPKPAPRRAPAPTAEPTDTAAPTPGPAPVSDPSLVPSLLPLSETEAEVSSAGGVQGVGGELVEFPGPVHTEFAPDVFQKLPPQPGTRPIGGLVALGVIAVLTFFMARGGRGV